MVAEQRQLEAVSLQTTGWCNEVNTLKFVLLSWPEPLLPHPHRKPQLGREHYVAFVGGRPSGGGLWVRQRACSSVSWVRFFSIWAGPQSRLGKMFWFI